MKVIYLEDDSFVRQTVKAEINKVARELNVDSIQVLEAETVDEAFVMIKAHAPELIISDMQLHHGELGTDLFERMKQHDMLDNINAIFHTSTCFESTARSEQELANKIRKYPFKVASKMMFLNNTEDSLCNVLKVELNKILQENTAM